MIKITANISISDGDIKEKFIRSPGAGGQKVNKTATTVQLRFDARKSAAITTEFFRRLERLAGRRLTKAGVVIITSHKYATQEKNRKEALERLKILIAKSAIVPHPRRKTMPTKGSNERRLDLKRQKSNIKRGRGRLRRFG